MPLEFELCPGRKIGGNNPCFIIAEIGQNHQGDIEIAKKMIKMAKVRFHLNWSTWILSWMQTEIQMEAKKVVLIELFNVT